MTAGNPLTALARQILERVMQELPGPDTMDGVVEDVALATDTQPARVTVRLNGATTAIPCSWSSVFGLELDAVGRDLIGAAVEVRFIGGKHPRIAYTLTEGDLS